MDAELSVIVPAYNESANIKASLLGIKTALGKIDAGSEIIVVDDGSTDDTSAIARGCGAEVVPHRSNLGYGRSLKDGIRRARGRYIALMDADGTYDAEKLPAMYGLAREVDMVVGRRVFSQESTHHLKNVARRFFAYQVSYYSGYRIEDLNSGQRIFRKEDVADYLDAYPDGFSFTSTQTVLYVLSGKKIRYMPIKYHHRPKGSKFLSRRQILAMTKLSLSLTLLGRPFKLAFQLMSVSAAATLAAWLIGGASDGGVLPYFFSFIAAFALAFFALLAHIYSRGRLIKRSTY